MASELNTKDAKTAKDSGFAPAFATFVLKWIEDSSSDRIALPLRSLSCLL
jgi:hypothetical protein